MSDDDLPIVAVVHTPAAAASLRDIVLAAQGLFRPVFVFPRPTALVTVAARLARAVVAEDGAVAEAVAAEKPAGVVTFDDAQLEAADAARTALDLPGAPAVEAPWDKLVQRSRLRERGVSTLLAEPVDAPADLLRAVETVGLPGVLKKRRGAAGISMRFLRDGDDVREELDRREHWAGMLYEQFITRGEHPSGRGWIGDHVSVETISDGHGRQHVAVFDKTPLSISYAQGPGRDYMVRETGDVYPSVLPDDVREKVFEKTSAALDALGVCWRVTHTELRATAETVEVIEVNGRTGGDVTSMLSTLGGADMVRAALATALGRPCEVIATPRDQVAQIDPSFPVRHGTVLSKATRGDLLRLPGVTDVGFVARHGDDRGATGYRLAGLRMHASSVDELAIMLRGTIHGLTEIFEADDFVEDEWARRMLEAL
jgi:biotin carboxylase